MCSCFVLLFECAVYVLPQNSSILTLKRDLQSVKKSLCKPPDSCRKWRRKIKVLVSFYWQTIFSPTNYNIVLQYKIGLSSFYWSFPLFFFRFVDNELNSLKRFEETSEDETQQVNVYYSCKWLNLYMYILNLNLYHVLYVFLVYIETLFLWNCTHLYWIYFKLCYIISIVFCSTNI